MRGTIIPVEITIYEDRSFTFITKTPPAAGSSRRPLPSVAAPRPRTRSRSARSTPRRSRDPETKMPDLNANDIDAAMKTRRGYRRSMGVTVE